jgi:hypothetical protein
MPTAARKAATTTKPKAATPPQEAPEAETTTQAAPASPGPASGVLDGLQRLRATFPAEEIGKLPKGTCRACRDLAKSYRACESHTFTRRCSECGGSHSSATIHLDYVGHADLTARLLEVDPYWTWEPFDQEQIMALPPALREGGLWINLTVLGVTRPGFGDAQGKTGPNAIKEMIGDALRNAGMRFGIALDLWAKGDRTYAKAEDATPISTVADAQADAQAVQANQQQALAQADRHNRADNLDDMAVADMPEADQHRWRTHMAAWHDTFNALPQAVQAEVQRTWPEDVPVPSTQAMTIRQIATSREAMKVLDQKYQAHLAANPPQ